MLELRERLSLAKEKHKKEEDDKRAEINEKKKKFELNYTKQLGNLTIHSHLNTKELNKVILSSDLIICRPGYSTIMDLAKLMKKAFFVPTPGQTEQEYLASLISRKKICYYQKQNEFNFEQAIHESKKYSGFSKMNNRKPDWEALFSLF